MLERGITSVLVCDHTECVRRAASSFGPITPSSASVTNSTGDGSCDVSDLKSKNVVRGDLYAIARN